MTAKDIMTTAVVTVKDNATLENAAKLMLEYRIGGLPVVDAQGKLCGIVTESDFSEKERCVPFSTFKAPQLFGKWLSTKQIEKVYQDARSIPVRDVMSREVWSVEENDAVETVIALMLRHDINRVPVVRAGRVAGIIARRDLLQMMVEPSDSKA
ncbi:MAG: CBS domain-containing protein [Bryobacteraceae bacterium]